MGFLWNRETAFSAYYGPASPIIVVGDVTEIADHRSVISDRTPWGPVACLVTHSSTDVRINWAAVAAVIAADHLLGLSLGVQAPIQK